jgi:predicted RNA binding protein YcfA (HicA-like mRNA interferase family)
MKRRKLLTKIISGSKHVHFHDFVSLLVGLGFILERSDGSHQVFTHPKLNRPFPVQDDKGEAKPYQVRQLLKLIEQHDLKLEEDEDE